MVGPDGEVRRLCVSPEEGRVIARVVDFALEADDYMAIVRPGRSLDPNLRLVMRNLADRVGGGS
jgi:hypothetical protein